MFCSLQGPWLYVVVFQAGLTLGNENKLNLG